jgi:hypothetical protein
MTIQQNIKLGSHGISFSRKLLGSWYGREFAAVKEAR